MRNLAKRLGALVMRWIFGPIESLDPVALTSTAPWPLTNYAEEEEPKKEQPPYPWCPQPEKCIPLGYCPKNPGCGD